MKRRGRHFWTPLRVVLAVLLMFILICLSLWLYLQGKNVAVLNPQGVVAAHEKDLMIFTVLLSAIVIIPVYAMLFTIAWRYREGNPKKVKYTPDVAGNRWMETIWWGIPIIIIGILCVVTWVSTHQLDPYRALDSNIKPLRVQVIALQWKWLFIYPDYHIASLNQLKIPAETPVNFEITADGPMSAFWVPNLGSQTYAMSGMSAQLSLMADRVGTYPGSNSNISGEGYADMTFDVKVLPSQLAFYQWARNIANKNCHDHFDWDEYENLAEPSTVTDVRYYHLHNDNLYTDVVNKYMIGSMQMAGMSMNHADNHGDGGNQCGVN